MSDKNLDFISVNELCIFAIDCVNKTAPVVDYKTPYKMIRTTNVKNGFIDLDTVRYVEEETFIKWTRRSNPEYGDVILTREAPVGSVGRYTSQENKVFLGQRLFHYRPDPKLLDWNFLAYFLQSSKMQGWLNGVAFGATVAHITVNDAETIKIPKINILKQRKIGKALANYDDLIENNNQRIKLLESMAEELYKEWFVRLRFPNWESVEVVDGLPVGWERKNIFELSDVIYGYPLKSSLFNDKKKGLPVVRIRDIKNNFSNTYTEETIENEKYFLKNGDLLVGMDGDFHMGIWSGGDAILNQRVVCFRPYDDMSKYYFYFAIKKDIDFLNKIISGTTVAHLSDRDLKKILLLVPNDDIMNKFKRLIDNIFELRIDLDIKNQTLKRTRDLLLPRLMSGKLNVEDLDII